MEKVFLLNLKAGLFLVAWAMTYKKLNFCHLLTVTGKKDLHLFQICEHTSKDNAFFKYFLNSNFVLKLPLNVVVKYY